MRIIILGVLVLLLVTLTQSKRNNPKCCDFACPLYLIYAPICAAPESGNGPNKTFASECELRRYNCQHNREYCKIYNGECYDDNDSNPPPPEPR